MDTSSRRGSALISARLTDATERLFAFALLAASSPVFVCVAIVILVLSRRTPFVAHLRRGQFGQPFWMWKFRTMWPREQRTGPLILVERVQSAPLHWRKDNPDPRITSTFARFCRKYSIDELPQLWHVLSGRMALIGPRPLTAVELEAHYGPDAEKVLTVKPGVTGLWQVCGRNSLTYQQRRRLDLFFVRHDAPGLRWTILRRSIAVVLSGRNAA
ncbi:sugar transferase [Paludibaculum fermentans]|uniref:Sugar transferase n=1 Tax=Paludibaculum fermentans TaxID=1473598 RepID=A0A7S7NRI4_PALFE|nr:sugar transferase [Paludibaculum fermentans]QOY88452.1 sugar transferase [Paludibaculum fermentans]